MSSRHNVLRFGSAEDASFIVDEDRLTDDEVRAVILNLLDTVRRLEKRIEKLGYEVGRLETGVTP